MVLECSGRYNFDYTRVSLCGVGPPCSSDGQLGLEMNAVVPPVVDVSGWELITGLSRAVINDPVMVDLPTAVAKTVTSRD